jgi:hypothetical protein
MFLFLLSIIDTLSPSIKWSQAELEKRYGLLPRIDNYWFLRIRSVVE